MRAPWNLKPLVTGAVIVALLASALGLAAAPAAQAAGFPNIQLSKSGPETVLVGEPATYTLKVSNPVGPGRAYNVTFRDVLPQGVEYQPGSTTPASARDPKVIANQPAAGQTTLIWSNLFDLNVRDSSELSYSVLADPDAYPVGASFTNAATAYASNDPFIVPKFDAAGQPTGGGTGTATDSTTTKISAIEISKAEPSSESELVRGVHDNSTIYTITVKNNQFDPTNNVAVIDYLPASLEFLACGGVDNTSGSLVEYTGAPRLTAVPALGGTCVKPASVATLSTNPVGPAPDGLYTRVRWPSFDLAAGETKTITYRAGIPLYANTTTWPGLIPPLVSTGRQAANLDNNTGPSTAETATEMTLTNYVGATGSYQGDDVNGATPVSVSSYANETVTAEDLALQKSVSPGTYSIGGVATYTITARTSEYRSTADIAVTDTLPDALTYLAGTASATLTVSGLTQPVALVDDGSTPPTVAFSLTSPTPLPPNAVLVITFQARMQGEYANGAPTGAGDSFVNSVTTSGTTSPATGLTPNVPPGPTGADVTPEPPYEVTDASSATMTTAVPSTSKQIGQNRLSPTCGDVLQTYAKAIPSPPFQIGDRICFELNVRFFPGSDETNVLSPKVSDFLPSELAYEPGSAVVGPANTLPEAQISLDASGAPSSGGGSLTWTLGEIDPQATNPGKLVVRPLPNGSSAVFQVRFAAKVLTTVLDQTKDLQGNLLKAGAINSAGDTLTARDEVDFELAGSQVDMTKGIDKITRNSVVVLGPFPPNTDHKQVQAGDVATFRVDITNTGLSGAGSDVPVRNVVVNDVLPAGITCSDVVTASLLPDGTCSGSTLHWNPATGTIAANASKTLTYDVVIPDDVTVNTKYTNTATVNAYESFSNGGWVVNHPLDVTDVSDVFTGNVSVTKLGTTSITATANNQPNQFTVGERITYTVDALIPPGTTARSGVITDTLPSTLRYVDGSAVGQYSATGLAPGLGALPSGAVLTVVAPRTVRLTLPPVFANTSASASALFRVTFDAVVLGTSYSHGQTITNAATFSGTTFSKSSQYASTVVIPNPVIDKANNASGPVLPGDHIGYTLTLSNPASSLPRPTSYDTIVVDCLPAGMTFLTFDSSPVGTATPNGCASGGTKLEWTVGDLPSGPTQVLTYTAEVASGEAAGRVYTNSATVTGSSIADGDRDPAKEGVYSASSSSSVSVANGDIAKSVDPSQAAAGQKVTWTVTATYLAAASYYDAVVTDSIPSGIDIDSVSAGNVTCSGAPVECATLTAQPGFGDQTISGRNASWLVGDVGVTPADLKVTVTYTATVATGAGLTAGDAIVNSATSTWNTTNDDPSSSITSKPASAVLVVTQPQLAITKDVSTATPTPGSLYTYSVTVTGVDGDEISPAFNVTVVDHIPSGVLVDGGTISDGGRLTGADATLGGGLITWHLPGPITSTDFPTLTYQAKLPASATSGDFTNTVGVDSYESCRADYASADQAFVCATDGDRGPSVEPAEATVTVGDASADLAIVKTPSGSTTPGSPWTFTMKVSNHGPSDALGPIVVTDSLPAGLTYVTHGPLWSCAPSGQVVTCILLAVAPGDVGLAAGESAPDLLLSVNTAASPSTATYVNTASVTSGTPDPNPANNQSSASVSVSPTPVTPTDPEVPVTPIVPPVVPPVVPPITPPKPPITPGKPPVTIQRPKHPIPVPGSIKPGKPTVVLPGVVVTNAGQKVTVTVSCRPLHRYGDRVGLALDGSWVPLGDVSYCHVTRSKSGKVTVTVNYPEPVLVKVTYSAPKVPGYTAFTRVKRYVVVPR